MSSFAVGSRAMHGLARFVDDVIDGVVDRFLDVIQVCHATIVPIRITCYAEGSLVRLVREPVGGGLSGSSSCFVPSTSTACPRTQLDVGLSSPARLHDHFVSLEAVTPGEYKTGGVDLAIRYGFTPTP